MIPLHPSTASFRMRKVVQLEAKIKQRSKNANGVEAAAYRAGEKLTDHSTGQTFDFSRKSDVNAARIFLPPNAPAWMADREKLWSAVEAKETRVNSQLARDLMLVLPIELSPRQNGTLVTEFVKDNLTRHGMVADVCLHGMQTHNPHAHILITTRAISGNGFGKKVREWNDRRLVAHWREDYAKKINRLLEQSNDTQRYTHLSYQDQGLKKQPGRKRGPALDALTKKLDEIEVAIKRLASKRLPRAHRKKFGGLRHKSPRI